MKNFIPNFNEFLNEGKTKGAIEDHIADAMKFRRSTSAAMGKKYMTALSTAAEMLGLKPVTVEEVIKRHSDHYDAFDELLGLPQDGLTEGKDFAVEYSMFKGRDGHLVTMRKEFSTKAQMDKFIDKISDHDNFNEILAVSESKLDDVLKNAVEDAFVAIINYDSMGYFNALKYIVELTGKKQSAIDKILMSHNRKGGCFLKATKQIMALKEGFEGDIFESQGVALTGSPRDYGFKTKDDFLKVIGKYGYTLVSPAKAKYIIGSLVDSGKAKYADKNGKEFFSYGSFLHTFCPDEVTAECNEAIINESLSTDWVQEGTDIDFHGNHYIVKRIIERNGGIVWRIVVEHVGTCRQQIARYNGHMYILGEYLNESEAVMESVKSAKKILANFKIGDKITVMAFSGGGISGQYLSFRDDGDNSLITVLPHRKKHPEEIYLDTIDSIEYCKF